MIAVRDTDRIPRRRLRGRVVMLGACGVLLTALHVPPAAAPAAMQRAGADGTATDAAVSPELRRYYQQELHWVPCPDSPPFQCTTVKVPLDYAHPDAGDILLKATRKKATGNGARIGSLLVNPGGPGVSAVDFLAGTADGFSPAVRASYDLVAVDPRGVGESTPVDCETDIPATSMGFLPNLSADPAEIGAYDEAFKQVATTCARDAGRLLPHVGTLDAARDMDVLRALLGDDRLHYVGISYGTYLGATYADLFPSRVGRLVLDGAVDPTLDGYQHVLQVAAGYQTAWESFAADCASRTDCPLGHSVEEISRGLDTLRSSLDRAPIQRGKDISVTGEDLMLAVTTALRDYLWEELRAALRGVLAGDTTALQQLLGTEEDDSGNAIEALYAVNCLSSPTGPRFTPAQAQAALPQFLRASPQFGESMGLLLMMCAHWPVPPAQPAHPLTAPGAAPILVVGTTRDPATPYPWAKALARQLSSGRLLTYDADGHAAYRRGSTCIDTAVDRYLTRGQLPPTGKVCT
ncbi:alpha/beta hydrolase [Streptomyces sp. NPDC059866]|uniref:alpha/beta hydrolase n=1 Tax=Streptomyces sp. NPDC059866 TaxID=3346978 RepID=UPI003651E665